jgi:uncharacterized protein YjbJ (UPF0337 family)
MTEHNKAAQARKGLIDSVKGKAKEIAGAVTGNDSLTTEGQLEQTQAQQRKEANSVEAVADAEAAQAHAAATKAKLEGAEERIAVSAKTAAIENSVRTEQAAHHRAAEQAGQRDAVRAKTQAERDGAIVDTCGSRSLCGLLGSSGVVRPFDQFAALELCAGADERHEMGRVDRPPA